MLNFHTSQNLCAHYLHSIDRLFRFICFEFVDLAHSLNSFGHTSKDSMLVVKPRARYDCDEELRSVGIGSSIGHRQDVRSVEPVLLWSEFVLKHASPNGLASSAVTLGASCLVHEAFDDSVEDHTIVVVFLHQFDEVFTGFRAVFKIQ